MSTETVQPTGGEAGPTAPAAGKTFTQEELNAAVARDRRKLETDLASAQKAIEDMKTAQLSDQERAAKKAVDEAVGTVQAQSEAEKAAIRLDHKLELAATRLGIPEVFMPSVRALLPEGIAPDAVAAEVKKIVDANPAFAGAASPETVQRGGGTSGGGSVLGPPWTDEKVRQARESGQWSKYSASIGEAIRKGQVQP